MDFVLQKSLEDLRREGNKRLDYDAIEKYFGYLMNSNNSLKAVYALMHIARLKDTAVYLLFVLKKAAEGVVNFDTLEENARADCDYIKSELVKNFTLSGAATEEPELRIPEISGTGLSELIKETNFKVESEENENITEEFTEMEMYEEEISEAEEEISDEEFELITSEDSEDDALELIGANTDEVNEGIEETEITEEEVSKDEPKVDPENIEENAVLQEEITETPMTDFEEVYNSEEGVIEDEVIHDNETTEELLEEKAFEEVSENINNEENSEQTVETEEEKQEEEHEFIESLDEVSNESSDESSIESDEYKQYESTLLEVNELLNDYFLDIENVTEGSAAPDGEPVLFGKIAELCYIMQERSDKMSFSIISSIYTNIGGIFRKYVSTNSRPVSGEMEKIRSGIRVVEGLIMGYEMEEADDIIASLYNLRKSFDDTKTQEKQEEFEESPEILSEEDIKSETEETLQEIASEEIAEVPATNESAHLKDKYSNSELRESFKQMKSQILDLEKTFNSLDEIEGDYQNYEGLRKLSTTFNNLKEIIRRANMLELREVAKLSEASYVFIKFIQNYRMNPFDDDIREIFKYIIYNFKAASLDKPNDDMERFISYLNDPVKIFTQKNKK